MPWSSLQASLRRISTPIRHLISLYALLVALFTLLRLLRVSGPPLIDLANTFAPYWFMPLVVTFPLSIIVTRGGALPAAGGKRLLRLSKPGEADNERAYPPRWSVLLQIGLIAIGLYSFAAPGMYYPVEPPAGDTFSVVTFNVQGSNHELGLATEWLLETAPDVIVLQETARGYDQRLAPLYDVYAHEDHIEGSARVFSRYAILEREILNIEDEPGLDALRLVLDQAGRELAVYALHFTLPLKPRPQFDPDADIGPEALLRYDERRRNAQIRRFLELARGESKPYVVAGDFNMSDASLIYDDVAAQMRDAWRGAGVGAGRTWPVAEAIGLPRVIQPLLRIDYVWHSAALRPVAAAVGAPIGSDHLPVTVEFEWRSIPPPSPGPIPHTEGRGAREFDLGEKSPSLFMRRAGRVDTDRRHWRTGRGLGWGFDGGNWSDYCVEEHWLTSSTTCLCGSSECIGLVTGSIPVSISPLY